MAMPEQLVAQRAMIFVHRVILTQRPLEIFNLLEFPMRSMISNAPRIKEISSTRRRDRSMIHESVRIYANLPKGVNELPIANFIKYVKKAKINTDKNSE